MAIFAVLAAEDYPQLAAEIQRLFPDDNFKTGPGQWLISYSGTATPKEISDNIGISEGRTGTGIVIRMGGYYGRHKAELWDWISSRLAPPPVPVAATADKA